MMHHNHQPLHHKPPRGSNLTTTLNTNTHQWSQPCMHRDNRPPTKADAHQWKCTPMNGNEWGQIETNTHKSTACEQRWTPRQWRPAPMSRCKRQQAQVSELLAPHFTPLPPPSISPGNATWLQLQYEMKDYIGVDLNVTLMIWIRIKIWMRSEKSLTLMIKIKCVCQNWD